MNCFKKILKLVLSFLMVINLSGCFFSREFSIEFWFKPNAVSIGSEIVSISDGKQSVVLYENLQDENYIDTGLTLSHDNGQLYKDGSTIPEINNYTYIVITFNKDIFTVYSDGQKVCEGQFSKNFKTSSLSVVLNSDNGEFKEYNLISSCLSGEEIISTYKENISYKLENIVFSEELMKDAKGKVALPLTRNKIVYSLDNDFATIENNKYLVFEENNDEKDKVVKLTAQFEDAKKEIEFCIKGKNKKNALEEACQKLDNNINNVISTSNKLATEIDGYTVVYEVVDGNVKFVNDHFEKSDIASEKEQIKIRASIDGYNIEKDVVLLDDYYGYLLVTFEGFDGWPVHEYGYEELTFYLSKDLKNYEQLDIKVSTNEGTNRFRDPFVSRDIEGNFVLLATQGYYNQGIYVLTSNDLINYECKLVNFAETNYDMNLSGIYTWAPEYIYDGENYIVYYSDTGKDNSCIYAVKTKNFVEFSYPYVLFDAGYSIIDANITEINGRYCLMYKDEREEQKTINYAVCDTLDGNWSIVSSITYIGFNMEGPFILKDSINNKIHLFTDEYHSGDIYQGIINDIDDIKSVNIQKDISLSEETVKHFSIIELTKVEYEKLMEAKQ